jgi:hypothetical protein
VFCQFFTFHVSRFAPTQKDCFAALTYSILLRKFTKMSRAETEWSSSVAWRECRRRMAVYSTSPSRDKRCIYAVSPTLRYRLPSWTYESLSEHTYPLVSAGKFTHLDFSGDLTFIWNYVLCVMNTRYKGVFSWNELYSVHREIVQKTIIKMMLVFLTCV